MKSLLLVLTCLVLLSSECRKSGPPPDNPYGLPNATQNGFDRFACLVDGKKFISNSNTTYGIGARVRGDTLGVSGQQRGRSYFIDIGFSLKGPLRQGATYTIDSTYNYALYGSNSTCKDTSYAITTAHATSGTIQLTKFDTIHKVVSGTFNLTFPFPGCDTLKVTEGRFDYQYY